MKFTEEQYQKIIEIWNNEYAFEKGIKEVLNYIKKERLANAVYESTAIANPLTREWAHDQFVEKEKRYVWRLKSDNTSVINKTVGVWFLDKVPSGIEYFSEKEIAKSPFKPEWFNKEEAE